MPGDTRLVKWWASRCLGLARTRRPPVNIERVVKATFGPRIEILDIRPVPLDPGFSGRFSITRGRRGTRVEMHYDESLEVPSLRHVLAHEVWHLIRTFALMKKKRADSGRGAGKEERDADLFARHLLVPDRFMDGARRKARKTGDRLHNLALVHHIAERFVVPVRVAEARMRDIMGHRWKALPERICLPEQFKAARRGATYRVRVVDHRGKATVMRGLTADELHSRIEMTVTWSGEGPKRGRPPRGALPAVVAVTNEKKKSDCWYYEGVGLAGVLDLRGEWGETLIERCGPQVKPR